MATADEPGERLLTGWRFAAASAGFFLGPVACAILGSAALDTSLGSAESQLLGSIGGLVLGVAGCQIAIRAWNRFGQVGSGVS